MREVIVKYASGEVLVWWHYSTKPIIADKLLSLWGFSLSGETFIIYSRVGFHFLNLSSIKKQSRGR